MKLTNEIIKAIQERGKRGAEECEKYLDIAPIPIDKELTAYQLCFFSDIQESFAYCLDREHNGYWVSNLKENVIKEITKQLEL